MGMCGKDLADAYEMIGDWPLLADTVEKVESCVSTNF